MPRAASFLVILLIAVAPADADDRHRGVGWVAGREITVEHLEPLLAANVAWIAQTPFGWGQDATSPEIALVTGGRVLWGETDEGLRVTTGYARELGISTMLKPHIWLRDGTWCGEIRMETDEAWERWFANYRRFILHYAALAEELGIEALCVGTELQGTSHRTADWRRVISVVRDVYAGRLTYGANWSGEFERIRFWDDLDFIGIHAYFPLADGPSPSVDELVDGWAPWLERIETVRRRYLRPVVFTEIGYRSTADAAIRPWEWPGRGDDTPPDEETQARLYEAFFTAVWERPWCAGAFVWKWYPARAGEQPRRPTGFTPQGKRAEAVMSVRFFDREYTGRRVFAAYDIEAPPLTVNRGGDAAERPLWDLPIFAVDPEPGHVIGDIGFGSGRHALEMATLVGPTGRVHCRDVSERSVESLRSRIPDEVRERMDVRLSEHGDVGIPGGTLDVALLSDVYHIVLLQEETKDAFVESVLHAMKPGGVVVVTFTGTSWLRSETSRARIHDETLADFTAAGFEAGRRYVFEEDAEQPLVLEFRRPR